LAKKGERKKGFPPRMGKKRLGLAEREKTLFRSPKQGRRAPWGGVSGERKKKTSLGNHSCSQLKEQMGGEGRKGSYKGTAWWKGKKKRQRS